jgi:hypothetical protein
MVQWCALGNSANATWQMSPGKQNCVSLDRNWKRKKIKSRPFCGCKAEPEPTGLDLSSTKLIPTDRKYHVFVLFLTSLILFAELCSVSKGRIVPGERIPYCHSASLWRESSSLLWYIFVYSSLHNYLLSCHVAGVVNFSLVFRTFQFPTSRIYYFADLWNNNVFS